VLRAQSQPQYGRPTAPETGGFAKPEWEQWRAIAGRSVSLRILCDQLDHTRANLARLDVEIEQLLTNDPGIKGVQQVPEFGSQTRAVLARPSWGMCSVLREPTRVIA